MIKKIQRILEYAYMKTLSANKVATLVGVRFGKNCKFMTKSFGSEPYLIEIGDNFATSSGVVFITHDGSVNVLRNMYEELQDIDLFATIVIGNNVFVGLNAIILPNTRIGDNVIIGAGSVVRGEIESDSVYAGVPAKYICSIEQYRKKNIARFEHTKFMIAKEKKRFLLKKYVCREC